MTLFFWLLLLLGYITLIFVIHRGISGEKPASAYSVAAIMPGMCAMLIIAVMGSTSFMEYYPGELDMGAAGFADHDRGPVIIYQEFALNATTMLVEQPEPHYRGIATYTPTTIYGVGLPPPGIWGTWHFGLAMVLLLRVILDSVQFLKTRPSSPFKS